MGSDCEACSVTNITSSAPIFDCSTLHGDVTSLVYFTVYVLGSHPSFFLFLPRALSDIDQHNIENNLHKPLVENTCCRTLLYLRRKKQYVLFC